MSSYRNNAAVVADYIAQAGISHVFTYPGDPTIELLEAVRHSGTQVVLARREGSAAFMAEGYAQATGNTGCCVSTLGPGSTALVNGVAAATWDRVPMLAISGQIETNREQWFTHQVVDHRDLFGPVSKWAGRLERGAVEPTMRKALRTAAADRPGAVHLSVGDDVFKADADADIAVRLPAGLVSPSGAAAGTAAVVRAPGITTDPVDVLGRAKRPVLLAGISAVRAGATAALTRLAETVGAPVVVGGMAKGVISEEHPYFAGVIEMASTAVVWDLLRSADVVVTVGFDAIELSKSWTLPASVIHVDSFANTDQVIPSDHEVIGHIPSILDWLADEFTGQPRWSEAEMAAHRQTLRNEYYSGRVTHAMNPTDVLDVVRAAMPSDTVVSCDVGSHKMLVGQGWTTTEPRGVLMSNGLSSMGFGLPAAIGAKLARPERPVAALLGDGGFAMVATEMRVAAALDAPIAVVVFADESLNRIELKQIKRNYPSTATRIEPMDLPKLAESMDCDGVRVTTIAELQKAAGEVAELKRPLLIEAVVDPAQYLAQY
jgi:acetolactate synthase I/II/III large subunit